MKIPFNKPHLTGRETVYIQDAVTSGKISGNGKYTKRCQQFFEKRYGFAKCLLTTSCTDALEMTAILMNIQPGDEVIVPSYAFVSTANAFVLRGANIVFVDSNAQEPNIDADLIEESITRRTKAIVLIHYAGVACDMDKIMAIAEKHGIYVVEDAAQAVNSYYKSKPLGGIGHFATFSFHETKNVISGEGGMLVINDESFAKRAEIIWEKGTNRTAFFRGEIDKYGWVDIGSSFLPAELISAFLYAQLENLDKIQQQRSKLWKKYFNEFSAVEDAPFSLPHIPAYASNNAHMFYLVFHQPQERTRVIQALKDAGILAVFHYLSLHQSAFYKARHDGRHLPQSDRYTECLLRLPLFFGLTDVEQAEVIEVIKRSYV
jgi:dTDP-4-amino-4,6-dideoxygalactose transaminase